MYVFKRERMGEKQREGREKESEADSETLSSAWSPL